MDTNTDSDIYFGSCVRCGKRVNGAGRACQAMGELFHDTCFSCSICSKKLIGKPFYLSGRIFCEDDFLYSGVHPSKEICKACGCLIRDAVLQALGKSFHPDCFRCAVCKESLEGLPFAVDTENKVYCVRDYHKVQAPICVVCRKPILPSEGSTESIRVVSSNRNYHLECYDSDVM